jgi:small subunit ribosomal protein S15
VALLTQRLDYLSKHFEKHPKDRHSQRGMLLMISRRKGLLNYLKSNNPERYKNLISSLGLRK